MFAYLFLNDILALKYQEEQKQLQAKQVEMELNSKNLIDRISKMEQQLREAQV
jgi:hypothetical protein